jgi:hypothetical protein
MGDPGSPRVLILALVTYLALPERSILTPGKLARRSDILVPRR